MVETHLGHEVTITPNRNQDHRPTITFVNPHGAVSGTWDHLILSHPNIYNKRKSHGAMKKSVSVCVHDGQISPSTQGKLPA